MNIERINQLADVLERDALPVIFDMKYVFLLPGPRAADFQFGDNIPCDTVACIAGWACLLFAPKSGASMPLARELLDLSEQQADNLFMGQWANVTGDALGVITREQAVAELRRLVGSES